MHGNGSRFFCLFFCTLLLVKGQLDENRLEKANCANVFKIYIQFIDNKAVQNN